MKECTKCLASLPLDAFHKDKRGTQGRYYKCRPCTNKHRAEYRKAKIKADPDHYKNLKLKERYGISFEDRASLATEQDNKCKICLTSEASSKRGVLCVDHCHATGEVRGLLCDLCNKALGHFRDNPTLLKVGIAYLTNNGDI